MAMQIYVNFNGNCREAVEFYAEVFGTEKPKFMLFGDTPPNPEFPLSEETKKLVMHTQLNIKGDIVMFSDVPAGRPLVIGNNISITLSGKDINDIKSIFNKLKVGGKIIMDLQETFWSKCYGYLTDKYGIPWQLSLDSET